MLGHKQFSFNLQPLLSTTNHGVTLADDATNLTVKGIGNMAFKFDLHVVAIHSLSYASGLAGTLFLALDFDTQQECGFTICCRSSWLKFLQFQVPCDTGPEDIMMFGSPPTEEEILTSHFY
eukprot:7407277-Ditylum_brightwellii.AAC.1